MDLGIEDVDRPGLCSCQPSESHPSTASRSNYLGHRFWCSLTAQECMAMAEGGRELDGLVMSLTYRMIETECGRIGGVSKSRNVRASEVLN